MNYDKTVQLKDSEYVNFPSAYAVLTVEWIRKKYISVLYFSFGLGFLLYTKAMH